MASYLAINGQHYGVPEAVYWYVKQLEARAKIAARTINLVFNEEEKATLLHFFKMQQLNSHESQVMRDLYNSLNPRNSQNENAHSLDQLTGRPPR